MNVKSILKFQFEDVFFNKENTRISDSKSLIYRDLKKRLLKSNNTFFLFQYKNDEKYQLTMKTTEKVKRNSFPLFSTKNSC